tara:strand:- start:1365 stop:2561 length:1197 start_codon:yes stop_codon:yes gene_type:complete
MNQQLILANYKEELEKVAATAALKLIRTLVNAGKLAKANRLASSLVAKGGLKTTQAGSKLRFLGSGAEGPASLVIGAKASPGKAVVRKMMDPRGPIFSKQQASTKFNMMRRFRAPQARMGGHPASIGDKNYAKLVSNKLSKTPTGGRYYHAEYVPGKDLGETATRLQYRRSAEGPFPKKIRGLSDIYKTTQKSSKKNVLGDVIDEVTPRTSIRKAVQGSNSGNIMISPSGKAKTIDFLAFPRGYRKNPEALKFENQSPSILARPGWMSRAKAAGWRARVPGAQTSASDFVSGDMRRADPLSALRSLGPGSPRTGKLVRGATGPKGERVFATPTVPYRQPIGKPPRARGPVPSPAYEKMLKGIDRRGVSRKHEQLVKVLGGAGRARDGLTGAATVRARP